MQSLVSVSVCVCVLCDVLAPNSALVGLLQFPWQLTGEYRCLLMAYLLRNLVVDTAVDRATSE